MKKSPKYYFGMIFAFPIYLASMILAVLAWIMLFLFGQIMHHTGVAEALSALFGQTVDTLKKTKIKNILEKDDI